MADLIGPRVAVAVGDVEDSGPYMEEPSAACLRTSATARPRGNMLLAKTPTSPTHQSEYRQEITTPGSTLALASEVWRAETHSTCDGDAVALLKTRCDMAEEKFARDVRNSTSISSGSALSRFSVSPYIFRA